MCERVIIINKGKIIADERTDEITRTIEEGYRYEVKISGPQQDVLSALKKIVGVKEVEATGVKDGDAYAYVVESERGTDVRKPIFNVCSRGGWPIVGLAAVGTDLESVFIRLVDRSDNPTPVGKKNKRR